MTNWQDYIHSNPKILSGKPVVRGTRLSVEFILERFADGWTEQEVLENDPRLSRESLKAIFAYACQTAEKKWAAWKPSRLSQRV